MVIKGYQTFNFNNYRNINSNRFIYSLLKVVSYKLKVWDLVTKSKIYSSEKTACDRTFCTLIGPDFIVRVFKPLVLLLKRFPIWTPHTWKNKIVCFYDLFKTLFEKCIILVIILLRGRRNFYSEDLIKKRLCEKKKTYLKLRKNNSIILMMTV